MPAPRPLCGSSLVLDLPASISASRASWLQTPWLAPSRTFCPPHCVWPLPCREAWALFPEVCRASTAHSSTFPREVRVGRGVCIHLVQLPPTEVIRGACLFGEKEVEMDKIGKNRLGPICRGILYVSQCHPKRGLWDHSPMQQPRIPTWTRRASQVRRLWQTPSAVPTGPPHSPFLPSGPLCRHL